MNCGHHERRDGIRFPLGMSGQCFHRQIMIPKMLLKYMYILALLKSLNSDDEGSNVLQSLISLMLACTLQTRKNY